jgi:hypothetical protein
MEMENLFMNAGIIAIIYLLLKFAEMRLVLKENKPLKDLLKDTFIVYISILLGMYIIDQLMPSGKVSFENTKAFIDNPEF